MNEHLTGCDLKRFYNPHIQLVIVVTCRCKSLLFFSFSSTLFVKRLVSSRLLLLLLLLLFLLLLLRIEGKNVHTSYLWVEEEVREKNKGNKKRMVGGRFEENSSCLDDFTLAQMREREESQDQGESKNFFPSSSSSHKTNLQVKKRWMDDEIKVEKMKSSTRFKEKWQSNQGQVELFNEAVGSGQNIIYFVWHLWLWRDVKWNISKKLTLRMDQLEQLFHLDNLYLYIYIYT